MSWYFIAGLALAFLGSSAVLGSLMWDGSVKKEDPVTLASVLGVLFAATLFLWPLTIVGLIIYFLARCFVWGARLSTGRKRA